MWMCQALSRGACLVLWKFLVTSGLGRLFFVANVVVCWLVVVMALWRWVEMMPV